MDSSSSQPAISKVSFLNTLVGGLAAVSATAALFLYPATYVIAAVSTMSFLLLRRYRVVRFVSTVGAVLNVLVAVYILMVMFYLMPRAEGFEALPCLYGKTFGGSALGGGDSGASC